MRRREAIALLSAALVMTVSGLVWLFGAYALAGCGVALLAVTLFVDVGEE